MLAIGCSFISSSVSNKFFFNHLLNLRFVIVIVNKIF